jgi:hypothetical protein
MPMTTDFDAIIARARPSDPQPVAIKAAAHAPVILAFRCCASALMRAESNVRLRGLANHFVGA